MSKIEGNHRYHPYYRTKHYHNEKRHDHDYKRPYKKPVKSHYDQYSTAKYDNRIHNDLSTRRSYRNNYHYETHKKKSRPFPYFSTTPQPLMSTQIPPLMPSPSHPPPPPPPLTATAPVPLLPPSPSIVPHERESWIRSVKKTKLNESVEQKTQYLETMLRMPQQQKSILNSSTFDRMRFADRQQSITTTQPTTIISDNLENSSFHLIGDISNHDDICRLEKVLFDNEIESQTNSVDKSTTHQSLPTPPPSVVECEPNLNTDGQSLPCSGFLIDNCDEEEQPLASPPPRPLLPPPSSDQFLEQNDEDMHERRAMLVSELDAADAEQRKELRRQKRLHKKLQKKKNEDKQLTTISESEVEQTISISNNDNKQELLSDWVIEYDLNDNNQMSQLTDEIRRTSIEMTDEDKAKKVDMILMKIKKQQDQLRKLKQYVMSMLGEQPSHRSREVRRQNSNIDQDLLVNFINQSMQSGCWLCSGKMYAEAAIQCDDVTEQ